MADQSDDQKLLAQVGSELRQQMTNMVQGLVSSQKALGKQLGIDTKSVDVLEKQLKEFGKRITDYTDNALGVGKAVKRVDRAIGLYSIDLGATAKELETLSKELLKEGTKGGISGKIKEQTRKIRELRNSVEENQKEFADRMLLGGWSEQDRKALIEAYKIKEGPSKDVSAEIAKIDLLQADVAKAVASGAENQRDLANKLARAIKDVYKETEDALGDRAREIEKIGNEWQAKVNAFTEKGLKVPLNLRLRGWSQANGGAGYAATANQKLQGSELAKQTGVAGAVGGYFKDDGKVNWIKIATDAGKKAFDNAKTGFEAYKSTGRQFGMEGKTLGGMSQYGSTSMDLAAIGYKTGNFDKADQLKTFQATSEAVRSGSTGKDKYTDQMKATEDVMKASNSMGVSGEKLATVLLGIRTNLGGSSNSITGYLGDMKDTLTTINTNVDKDMKISGEELADIYSDMSKDVNNAGINMKTFSQYTKESQIWARQLGVPLAKAVELGKQLADLKSGKSASAFGTFTMAAATGSLKGMSVGSAGKSQVSEKTWGAKSEDDFASGLQGDIDKASGMEEEQKKALKNLVRETDVAMWIRAAKTGNWAMLGTDKNQQTKFMQISTKLEKAGAGALLGINFRAANKQFAEAMLNLGGESLEGDQFRNRAMGLTDEEGSNYNRLLRAQKYGPNPDDNSGAGRKAGQDQIESESETFADGAKITDPTGAAKAGAEGLMGGSTKAMAHTSAITATIAAAKYAPKVKAGITAYKAGKGIFQAGRLATAATAGTGVGIPLALAMELGLDITEGVVSGGYQAYQDPKKFFGADMGTSFKERYNDPEAWHKNWENIKGKNGAFGVAKGLVGTVGDTLGSFGDLGQEGVRAFGKSMPGSQANYDWWSAYQNGQTNFDGTPKSSTQQGSRTTPEGKIVMTSVTTTTLDVNQVTQVQAAQAQQQGLGN